MGIRKFKDTGSMIRLAIFSAFIMNLSTANMYIYRYGNSLCLLDATYRTTKSALPLFFLAVKTNVGFSVVAEFVVQHETKASIMQGLETVRAWVEEADDKPQDWKWEPQFFMTDFCEREITAIEEVFQGIVILYVP